MKQEKQKATTYTLPLFEEYLKDKLPFDDLDRYVAAIGSSGLMYHGDPVLCCFVPTVFNESAKTLFEDITAAVVSISEKVTNRFISSPHYRSLWGLDAVSAELVMLDTGFSSPIPMMRVDVFLDFESGGFKFCEINTDGSSSMNEERCAIEALKTTEMFAQVSKDNRIQSQELFEPWVDTIVAIYGEWSANQQTSETLRVAIVDFSEDATMQEFLEFKARFDARRIDCLVADISDLKYRDGNLLVGEEKITAVYRRAVSQAIIDDLHHHKINSLDAIDGSDCDGSMALVSAVKYHAAAIIGGFYTMLTHSKQFFEMLWLRETWEFLDQKEIEFIKAHIPKTISFDAQTIDFDAIVSSKDRWILKPKNGLGTVGVFAGQDHRETEWKDICSRTIDSDYVVQEYCDQYKSLNIIPQTGMRDLQEFNYIVGLFVYAGCFAGSYIRAGQGSIIGSIRGSGVVGSLWYDMGSEPVEQSGSAGRHRLVE